MPKSKTEKLVRLGVWIYKSQKKALFDRAKKDDVSISEVMRKLLDSGFMQTSENSF